MTATPPDDNSESREQRTSVMLMAELHRRREPVARARVLNLSVHGVCIADPGGLSAGEELLVSLGSIERLCATVMWVRPGQAGLRFEHGINLDAARERPARRETSVASPSAGWMGTMNDPYRQHHRRRFD